MIKILFIKYVSNIIEELIVYQVGFIAMPKTKEKPPLLKGLEKSPTGIKGLDEITSGGVPFERTTLVCGGSRLRENSFWHGIPDKWGHKI